MNNARQYIFWNSNALNTHRESSNFQHNPSLYFALYYIALYILLVFQIPWAASETSGDTTCEAPSEAPAGSIFVIFFPRLWEIALDSS